MTRSQVLIGTTVGCGLAALFSLISRFQSSDVVCLPFWGDLWYTMSPLHLITMKSHRAAWCSLDAGFLAGFLVGIRLLTRSTLLTALIGIAALSLLVHKGGILTVSTVTGWPAMAFSLIGGFAIVALYTRVGILAGIAAMYVCLPHGLATMGLGHWMSPYGLAELVIILCLAAYGFCTSTGGQPLFRHVLDEP